MPGAYRKKKLERRAFYAIKTIHRFFRSSAPTGPRFLFVAGVQRSGTNMLMEALDRNKETIVFHETDKRLYENYAIKNVNEIAGLAQKYKAGLITIKCLMESPLLTQLLNKHPSSVGLWPYRHYAPMVRSNLANWAGGRNRIDDIVKDRTAGAWRMNGIKDETYREVCDLYEEGMNDASAIALFWYYRNKVLFDLEADKDARVRLIDYDTILQSPEQALKKVCEFLNLAYHPYMARSIQPQIHKDRPDPDIAGNIRERCDTLFEHLKRTEQNQP